MGISHLKTNTIADFTGTVTVFNSLGATVTANATDLVRPSDWNSAHLEQLSFLGNTAGVSTISGSNIFWAGGNNITLSASAGSVTISGPNTVAQSIQPVAFSAQGGSSLFSTLSFSNIGNNVTFSNSNGQVVLSHNLQVAGAYLTTARASNDAIGLNTAQSNVTWTVNSNGLSLDARNYAGVGTTFAGANLSASMTLNSNGLNLSMSAAAPGGGGAVNFSAGTTSNNLQSVVFANANGITFGLGTGASSQSITASHNGLTTARASNDAVGLNTAQTNVTWTVNSSGISINGSGYAGTGTTFAGANLSASMTLNSNGLNLSMSAAAPGGGGAVNFSAGTTSQNLQSVIFANANGITFGLGTGASSQSITASHNGITTGRASNDAIGLNTAFTAGPLAMTIDSSGLSLNAASAAGTTTGFAGANISGSMTHNTAGLNLSLSVAAPGGGAAATVSYWQNFVNYANSTNQANWPGSGTSGPIRVWGYELEENVAANMFSVPLNLTFGTAGTSSGSRTVFVYAAIYTQGSGASTSLLSLLYSASFSIGHSYNNSSNTLNHPTSTNSAGYTTGTVSSGGFSISSAYTGLKAVIFPIGAQTLTPGRYYLGIGGHVSSAGGTGLGLSGTWLGLQHSGNLAPMGSYSTAFSSGSNLTRRNGGGPGGLLDCVTYTLSATSLHATMAMSAFGKSDLGIIPIAFWSST
jgi:hypothetical protein